MPGELRTKLPEIHDAGRKAQELMKGFFLFNLIWVPEDFSLRDGDSLLDVFVAPSSYRCIIWSWSYYRGGTGRIVMDVLFQWYGRIDATWYVTLATQLLSNPQPCFVGTAPSTGRPGWSTTCTSTCQGSGR